MQAVVCRWFHLAVAIDVETFVDAPISGGSAGCRIGWCRPAPGPRSRPPVRRRERHNAAAADTEPDALAGDIAAASPEKPKFCTAVRSVFAAACVLDAAAPSVQKWWWTLAPSHGGAVACHCRGCIGREARAEDIMHVDILALSLRVGRRSDLRLGAAGVGSCRLGIRGGRRLRTVAEIRAKPGPLAVPTRRAPPRLSGVLSVSAADLPTGTIVRRAHQSYRMRRPYGAAPT